MVPVIIGIIRNYYDAFKSNDFQAVDFGKDGKNISAVFEIAKLLLNKTHPFVNIGLAALTIDKDTAMQIHSKANNIAASAEEIHIMGITLKSWLLEDYGNNLRYTKAKVKLYMTSNKDISLKHLSLIHKNGANIISEIKNAKRRALELKKENFENVECYVLKNKPMFSIVAIDINKPDGFISVDHYLIKTPSESRPKLIIYKNNSALFELYKNIFNDLIADATPLTSINQ